MRIRTARDIGAVIRERRKKKGLDQAGLAALVGVGRQWINEVERGKPRAEVSLILKTLEALQAAVLVADDDDRQEADVIDINAIIAEASKPKK